LEYRRCLAVERLSEGYPVAEVADFLGGDPRSVRRWRAAFHQDGAAGLRARVVPGRPAKLTRAQEKIVLRWLDDQPTAHGFATELWTAQRLAQLIEGEGDIHFNPDYLPGPLAAAARLHAPEAAARSTRTRRGGHRGVAGQGLAAH
jgi:transposase